MNDGVYPGLTRSEYDAIDAINFSRLKHLARTPAHFRWACDHPSGPSEAMALGTAVHAAVLQPDLFFSGYAVSPKCDRRTKAGRQLAEEFEAAHAGKVSLETEDYDRVCWIRDALLANTTTRELLTGPGRNEVGLVWTDPETGTRCKGLVDRIAHYGGATIVIDLKTTQDASEWAFGQAVARFRYHAQAAWYLWGAGLLAPHGERRFVFIAAETDPPYCVAARELLPDALVAGGSMCRVWLDQYSQCSKLGVWPGYPSGVHLTALPRWAMS